MTTDASSGKPSRWQEAVIERVVHQTPRVTSVFLCSTLGPYQAGQHVDVRLTAPDGYQAERSYSIASTPGADRIELAIERLEGGEVSPYFDEVAMPGDTIEIRGVIVMRQTDVALLCRMGNQHRWIAPTQFQSGSTVARQGDVGTIVLKRPFAVEQGLVAFQGPSPRRVGDGQ